MLPCLSSKPLSPWRNSLLGTKVMGPILIMIFLFSFEQGSPLLSVYPTEQDRQNAYELQSESASTDLSEIVKEIISLGGDVPGHFLRGKLFE